MKSDGAFIIAIIVLLAFFSTGVAGQERNLSVSEEVEQIKNMEISHVDLSTVPDGEYVGEFPFRENYRYRVRVTVKSGRMETIEVLENGTENQYAQKGLGVVPRMLEKQSPQVDAITGATVTSKALMKCVEKALSSK